jgi:leader peptidase (prepilin peptidase)/N-methyltransferase
VILFEQFVANPASTPALCVFLFFLGAIFGSFANVVIYRLPKNESIVFPGSRCQNCKAPVKWYNNVPIIAWFWLRGKCSTCHARFSFRYPFVEFLMAVLFAAAGAAFGFHWTLVEALIFIFGLVASSFIDIDHMILPDKFTLSGIVIGLIGSVLNPERTFLDAIFGVLLGGGFLWAVAYLYFVFRHREGMGGGDIKLLAWIGAVLGWKAIPVVILLSSVIGSLVGIIIAFRTKDGMSKPIPFGPYLAGAALIYLLLDGVRLSEWYLSMHGL